MKTIGGEVDIWYNKYMEKLLIIDGHSLLFQSFYGMPRKIINKNGEYVEAVICFTGILFKIIKMSNPQKLVVVFDGENKLERQELDRGYKANRTDFLNVEDENNPFLQLDKIQFVLSSLKMEWVETEVVEADDLIASIVNDYKKEYEIIVSSSDKDFFQLIDDNVSVFVYRGKVSKFWTKEEFFNVYGFSPNLFALYKSLVGDGSDNIKGVKGIGRVTATKLLNAYNSLENIFANIENVEAKTAKLLQENMKKIDNNYKIIELYGKTGLYNLPNCNYLLPNDSSTAVLKSLDIL